jgi:hypothetical protein
MVGMNARAAPGALFHAEVVTVEHVDDLEENVSMGRCA